jgi:hypothetical protein
MSFHLQVCEVKRERFWVYSEACKHWLEPSVHSVHRSVSVSLSHDGRALDASSLLLQPTGRSVRRQRTCSVVSYSCVLWRFFSMFNNASSMHQRSPPRPSSRVARTANIDCHRRSRPRSLFLVKDDFIVFNSRPRFVLIILYWCSKPIFVLLFDRHRIGWCVFSCWTKYSCSCSREPLLFFRINRMRAKRKMGIHGFDAFFFRFRSSLHYVAVRRWSDVCARTNERTKSTKRCTHRPIRRRVHRDRR